jgi:hypothetical protein
MGKQAHLTAPQQLLFVEIKAASWLLDWGSSLALLGFPRLILAQVRYLCFRCVCGLGGEKGEGGGGGLLHTSRRHSSCCVLRSNAASWLLDWGSSRALLGAHGLMPK